MPEFACEGALHVLRLCSNEFQSGPCKLEMMQGSLLTLLVNLARQAFGLASSCP